MEKKNRFNHYDIGWNYRYTNDLKKLPEFLQPAIVIQKNYRGWMIRKRLNGDLNDVKTTCWQSTLHKVKSVLNLQEKQQQPAVKV